MVAVPFILDANGGLWVEALWAKDLALHTPYIRHLTVAAPVARGEPSASDVSMNTPPLDRVRCVTLPDITNVHLSLVALPGLLVKLRRAIAQSDVVQAGFAGWPIPEGIYAIAMARRRGRFTISFVESSFWRATPLSGLTKRILSDPIERFVRRAIRSADFRVFTSHAYRDDMLGADNERTGINTATWIDAESILSQTQAHDAWLAKSGPVRLLFAGRLVEDKGVPELLEALEIAAAAGCTATVTIIGQGEWRDRCAALARKLDGRLDVQLLEPLPPGPAFQQLLRAHDAVLLPSVSDEQPRLPFDAFAQAVPVLGFDTGGVREVVTSGRTGQLASRRDSAGLAQLIVWASSARPALKAMGMTARETALGMTHAGMHTHRHALYLEALGPRAFRHGL